MFSSHQHACHLAHARTHTLLWWRDGLDSKLERVAFQAIPALLSSGTDVPTDRLTDVYGHHVRTPCVGLSVSKKLAADNHLTS